MSDQIRQNSTLSTQFQELTALALKILREVMEDPKASPSVRLKAALAVLNRRKWVTSSEAEPIQSPEADMELFKKLFGPNPGPPIAESTTPRNATCPCGSGVKYKRCCGVAAPPHVLQQAAA